MSDQIPSRSVLTVDLKSIQKNFLEIQKFVSPAAVMPVLKANAYGMGLLPVAEAISEHCEVIGVANLQEALSLAHLSTQIHILGACAPSEIEPAIEARISMAICDLSDVDRIEKAAQKVGQKAIVHILIDTGMGRLGIHPDQFTDVYKRLKASPQFDLVGAYSHFPSAYEDHEFSLQQIERLKRVVEPVADELQYIHIANSDGINNVSESYASPFNMVRAGINLYGYFDDHGQREIPLQKVIQLKSTLMSVRDLKKGESIGYGRDYILKKDARVGTVAIGYADGLPMGISGQGCLEVNGQLCPVIGRVSMDYTTILLDAVPQAQVGDTVTCLGGELNCEQWAQYRGSITYEVICSIGQRVKRVYA